MGEEGLSIGDLVGLEEIELMDSQTAEKDNQQILVVYGKHKGEEIDAIGFFGEKAINAALSKGEKKEGKVFLKVPAKFISKGEKRIIWVNNEF